MAILHNVPLADYLAQTDFCSHSRLRDFAERGPRYYHDRYLARILEREETPELRFGTAFELLFQTGEEAFRAAVAVRPAHLKGKGNTKAGQEWTAAHRHLLIIDDEEYAAMLQMAASLREAAGIEMLEGADAQITLTGEAYGIAMQSRPDWLKFGSGLEVTRTFDLKTTRSISDFRHSFAVTKFGYDTQAAVARKLLRAHGHEDTEHYLVVVEKQPSYRATVFRFPARMLDAADAYLQKHASELRECQETNDWPRASKVVQELELPRWMRDEPEAAE